MCRTLCHSSTCKVGSAYKNRISTGTGVSPSGQPGGGSVLQLKSTSQEAADTQQILQDITFVNTSPTQTGRHKRVMHRGHVWQHSSKPDPHTALNFCVGGHHDTDSTAAVGARVTTVNKKPGEAAAPCHASLAHESVFNGNIVVQQLEPTKCQAGMQHTGATWQV